MKKIIGFLFLMMMIAKAQSQTVDEVLANYENAVGGRNALQAVKTIQYKSTVTINMMGNPMDIPVTVIKENKKLLRREVSGVMGMGKTYSILTDTAGYTVIPSRGGGFGGQRIMIADGGPGGGGPPMMVGGGDNNNQPNITKIKDETVKQQQYELDAAGPFGHLVNYAAKNFKAELQGTSKVNKIDCYKIKFSFDNNQSMTYYIDTKTFLIIQTEGVGRIALEQVGLGNVMDQMGSDRVKKMNIKTTYSEWKDFNGIKFPTKEKLEIGAVEINIVNSDYKVNEPIDAKYYLLK